MPIFRSVSGVDMMSKRRSSFRWRVKKSGEQNEIVECHNVLFFASPSFI
jgi:hypothetical protein